MSKIYLLLIAALAFSINTQSQQNWSRVKVFGTHAQLQLLGDLGLPVDHGEYKYDTYFMTDLSDSDITKLDQNGFAYEIMIQDVKAHYVEQNDIIGEPSNRAACPTVGATAYNPTTPANFQLGTMGGYYKYQEFLDELDSMRSKYPNLISAKAPIDTYTTIDGNPIYWLRISDNPDVDEAEDEVMYSSIHHAREPASLSQTIYFMWYMLENYGTDSEVTYLVDNTEMYFVPMINPDGYRYNESTDPNGGGMHRKNRRDVGIWNKGVDLNRNYGYHWNESGTSPDFNDDTYAGTGPFSEVESQAMRWFCEQHAFKFAFNAHSHGNLLLWPIGWASAEFAPHHDYFARYTDHMVLHNGYSNIKSSGLYPASGDSDDWMYIDDIGVNGKDTIFALTPEVSSHGSGNNFWPPAFAIEDICRANIHMNMTQAHMPLVFAVVSDLAPSRIDVLSGYFNYDIERLGLTDGDITVSMTAVAGIQTLTGSNVHSLNIMDIEEDSIQFTLNSGIQFGDDIIYVIESDNGTWTRMDTIYKNYGTGTTVFTDDCTNLDNWTGSWSFTNEDFVSPNNCITDSPFTDHQGNANSDCELIPTVSFDNATYAYATFWAKWEIEDGYDYVQFMISTNGGTTWTPLCGKYTNQGNSNQDLDNPLYDNFQSEWVFEEVDLSGYIGVTDATFKFRLISDGGVEEDGFYFDDFSIYTDAFNNIGIDEQEISIKLYPNPASHSLNIFIENFTTVEHIQIVNELGQAVSTIVPSSTNTVVNTAELAEGIYYVNVIETDGTRISKRFTVIR